MKVDKPVINEVSRSIARLISHGFLSEKVDGKYVITRLGEQYLYALAQKNRIETEIYISERNRKSGMLGFAKGKGKTV
jgi:predicted transcriptional regulator